MENGNNLSSSASFGSSSCLSNGSSSHNVPSATTYEVGKNLELFSLSRLSSSLENLVVGSEYDYSDAEIEVEGIAIGVHRCILAARCPFFRELFRNGNEGSVKGGKPKYLVSELVPHVKIGYEVVMVVLNYLYTGKVKEPSPEVSTCVDGTCAHDVCGPAINYAVEMMYASVTFQIKELVMIFERHLLNLVDKVPVEDVTPIVKVAFCSQLKQLLSHCVRRIARFDVENIIIEHELPHEVVADIKSLRIKFNSEEEHDSTQVNFFEYLGRKHFQRIYRALDSDDVELVKLLIDESNTSLDGTYALHYAAAFCSPKTFDKVQKLGNADINLRNARGYTVLQIAATRKDPSIVLRVLERYASVLDIMRDGRTAVTIRRRLTRPKDYNEALTHGKETNMDRICIDVLESEMCRHPLYGNVPMSSMMKACDLHTRLLLLENRVAMARFMFPVEARLAMHIADADSTSEFAGLSSPRGSYRNLREFDLNELPSDQVTRIQQRLQALQKAVETSDRFFPNCSKVLDRFMEDDTLGDMLLEKGSPEEQRMKRMRYMELQADVMNAFNKDVTQHIWSGFSSSSSRSPSPEGSHSQLFSIRLRHSDEMPMLELGGMGKEQHGVKHFSCSKDGLKYCNNTFPLQTGLDAMTINENRIGGTHVERENIVECETRLNPSEAVHEIDEPLHFMGDFDDMTDVRGKTHESDEIGDVRGKGKEFDHLGDTRGKGCESDHLADVRGKGHEPDDNTHSLHIHHDDLSDSDPEQSMSSDTDFGDEFVDSDCEISDENDLFDSNIDSDAEVRGLCMKKQQSLGFSSEVPKDEKRIVQRGRTKKGNPILDMDECKLELGMKFPDTMSFKDAVKKHSIRHGRDVQFTLNHKFKVQAKCKHEKCPWVIYASKVQNEDTIVVKTYVGTHKCPRSQKVSHATPKFLAKIYNDRIKADPKWPIESMISIIQKDIKLVFNKWQMYRTRKIVNQSGSVTDLEQYGMLWAYAEEIRRSNPGTTVKIKSKSIGDSHQFKRLYICWGPLKRGFIDGCRPVICLDGCHLKTHVGGILLSAVGIDSNNDIYPFAYAVVDKEKKKSWLWFLQLLIEDLNIQNPHYFTIMSDKQKGLIDAVQQLLPGCEHRFCAQHLYGKFKQVHKGLALKNLFWKAAKATRVEDFDVAMAELKNRDLGAYEWLVQRPASDWSKSHFSCHSKCSILLNNLSRSFSALILRARTKPIVTMLEEIRLILMKRVHIRRDEMMKQRGDICPKIEKLLEDYKKKAMECISHWNGCDEFEVENSVGKRFRVHIKERSCACRRWELTGIPCPHAISAFYFLGHSPEDYMNNWYKKETYLKTYSHVMGILNDCDMWPKVEREPLIPPVSNKLPGRLKKHDRKRGKDVEKKILEQRGSSKNVVLTKMPRKGLTMTCKTCHKPNHNSRACPLKKDNPSYNPSIEVPAANQRKEPQSKKGGKQSGKGKKVMKKQYKSALVRRKLQSLTTSSNEAPHLPDRPGKRTKHSHSSNVSDVSKGLTEDVKFSMIQGQSSDMQTRGAEEEAPILGSYYIALGD